MFASLAVPNYRRYFFGILTSNTGNWMGRTALAWLVLMILTDQDATALGAVTALMFLPSLLLSPVGGALADRFSKRRLMITTQSVMAVNTLALGLLIVTGHVALWHVAVCALIDGTASAVDAPARQAFVSELVPKEHLPNAIGLNSTSFNTARLLGPGIAGVLILLIGTGGVLLLNAVTYVGVIVALASLDRSALHRTERKPGQGGILVGLAYIRRRPYIVLILTIAAAMGLFGLNYQMTNVMMAGMEFGKGAGEFGLLGTVMAVGTLTAALLAARRKRPRLLVIMVAMGVFVLSTLASAVAPTYWLFALLLVPCGLSAITVMITCNSLLQLSTDAAFRGRVMSVYLLLFLGSTPLAAPAIGWIGDTMGPRWTLGIGGLALAVVWLGAAFYLARAEDLSVRLDLSRWPWPLVVLRGEITEEQGHEFS
ncbi:MFS transporter [Granulicoccus sp. GXG6511]|uniref:MFS transporter n=1 Tax=Granulicoccus sp. GXG6511 TaxID=3381351 RepID=UPI003D7EC53F